MSTYIELHAVEIELLSESTQHTIQHGVNVNQSISSREVLDQIEDTYTEAINESYSVAVGDDDFWLSRIIDQYCYTPKYCVITDGYIRGIMDAIITSSNFDPNDVWSNDKIIKIQEFLETHKGKTAFLVHR